MSVPLIHVDAFTATPFAGNPAAVCVLEHPADAGWMQAVAAEMNLPETAFVVPQADGFGLRWFTPITEVDLCGHATLASAHVLFTHLGFAEKQVTFHSQSGPLRVAREADGRVEPHGELLGDVGEPAQRPQRPGRRPGRLPGAFQAPGAEQVGEGVGDLQQVGARHQLLADAFLQGDEKIAHAVELVLQLGRFAAEATTAFLPSCTRSDRAACRMRLPTYSRKKFASFSSGSVCSRCGRCRSSGRIRGAPPCES